MPALPTKPRIPEEAGGQPVGVPIPLIQGREENQQLAPQVPFEQLPSEDTPNRPGAPSVVKASARPDFAAMFPLTPPEVWENRDWLIGRMSKPHPATQLMPGAFDIARSIYHGGKRLLQTTKEQLDTSEGVKVGAAVAPPSTMMDVADIFPLSGMMGIGGKLALAANAPKAASFFSAVHAAVEKSTLPSATAAPPMPSRDEDKDRKRGK